jgi:hypothetical protein
MSQTAGRGFTLVGEVEDERPAPKTDTEAAQRNTQLLLLSLRAVSQRAVTAVSHLFTLLVVAGTGALWWHVLPEPTVLQLVGLGMWALFVLAVEWIRRRE